MKKRILRIIHGAESTPRPGTSALGVLAALVTVVTALAASGAHAADSTLTASWLPPDVRRHAEVVVRAAARHGVDADLLASMLLIESGGDPEAESPAGASGLMQIMPATARRIAEVRGIDAPGPKQLVDPELNVDLGAWYLARQLERFGEPHLAVAAYNAGPKRAQAHVEQGDPLPEESRRYADQVMALWSERTEPTSPTLSGLLMRTRERLRGRMKAPVALDDVRLGFGPNPHPIQKERYDHQGIDVRHPLGTAVHAPLSGVVRSVDAAGTDARGRYVVLQHGRVQTRYYHLDAVRVHVGQRVEAGERIGSVGNTGVSTGPHLHFEVREMGEPVDPALYYVELVR